MPPGFSRALQQRWAVGQDRITEWLRLEGPLEATWSKHFTQAGPPRATSEDHVQAAFGHLQAQRLYNLCAQHRSPFSSEPSCGGKTKAVEFGDSPCCHSPGKCFLCSYLSSNTREGDSGRDSADLTGFFSPKLKAAKLLGLLLPYSVLFPNCNAPCPVAG